MYNIKGRTRFFSCLTQHSFRATIGLNENEDENVTNITLKIDDELLRKARELALNKKTSINAIVKAKIEEFVSKDQSRDAALKGLDAFFKQSNARVGRKTWTRDDIHER